MIVSLSSAEVVQYLDHLASLRDRFALAVEQAEQLDPDRFWFEPESMRLLRAGVVIRDGRTRVADLDRMIGECVRDLAEQMDGPLFLGPTVRCFANDRTEWRLDDVH